MLRSAIKLGFFGALAYGLGRAFYSLAKLLITALGILVLFGCLFAWLLLASAGGYL
jgi:hypothetical protein